MLDGRRCLLVGGGKVATRKLEKLLSVNAGITVVAQKPSERIAAVAETGRITLNRRPFRDSDLENVFLVYVATDDHALNHRITLKAESQGILVCSVDQNWTGGSFITPACFSKDDVTVAVSTNGVSCRKAKLIKENLMRHMSSVETAELLILGTDHRHLPQQSIREPFHLDAEASARTGAMLMNLLGVHGFIILNTCNRIELIAAVQPTPSLIDMLKLVLRFDRLSPSQYYLKTGFDAFTHLTLTASGLNSQMPGENHITAQLKNAVRLAQENKWDGGIMQQLSDHVLHISKHIRNEVTQYIKSEEIEDAVMSFISARLPHRKDCRIILAGTGSVGRELMPRLAETGAHIDWLYHTVIPEINMKNVTATPLTRLNGLLPSSDLIVTALTSAHPVVTTALGNRMKHGAVVIDLGVPRNVDSALAALRHDLTIIALSDLKNEFGRNNDDMSEILKIAAGIINEHHELYDKFIRNYSDRNKGQQAFAGPDPADD